MSEEKTHSETPEPGAGFIEKPLESCRDARPGVLYGLEAFGMTLLSDGTERVVKGSGFVVRPQRSCRDE